MKEVLIFILLLTSHWNVSNSQSINAGKIELGNRITLHSKILNETRKLLIYSPKSVSLKKIAYPVIYVFDAESFFFTAVGTTYFLNHGSYLPLMPEAYIVGIVNTNRNRDMPVPQEMEQTNGAKNFYSFLSDEVVPYINKNYSTSGLNILAGHSQGGLFVTYAAFQNPKLFPFVLAMDAPITVTKSIEQQYSKKLVEDCGIKYVSVKSLFGWNDSIIQNSLCKNFFQITIQGENHETMPYKGFYDGLRFLFNDYLPPVKDWPFAKLADYYRSLTIKYGVSYSIPSKILLESAKQNIAQSKKLLGLELLGEYDKVYGSGELSQQLTAKAKAILKGPDERVEYALSHPSPKDEDIQPYLGKWVGVVNVPGGTDTQIEWEIKKTEGKYVLISDVMKQFKTTSDFLYINEERELVWGRRHNGGAIYISTGKLSDNGLTITGVEELIGYDYPAGMPAFKINTFLYKKR